MKTSFYFVLWIVLIFGLQFMGINTDFFITLFAVFIISFALNHWLRHQMEYSHMRSVLKTFDMIYDGNLKKFKEKNLHLFIFNLASFVYLALATVGFIFLPKGSYSLGELGIFAFFAAINGAGAWKSWQAFAGSAVTMQAMRTNPPQQYADLLPQRAMAGSFIALLPPPSPGERALRIANIVFAILAIIFGLIFLALFGGSALRHGIASIWSLIQVAYGGLTLMYGISDLITLILQE